MSASNSRSSKRSTSKCRGSIGGVHLRVEVVRGVHLKAGVVLEDIECCFTVYLI